MVVSINWYYGNVVFNLLINIGRSKSKVFLLLTVMAFNIARCASLLFKSESLTNMKISRSITRQLSSNRVLPIPRYWLKKEIQPKYHNQIEDIRPSFEKGKEDNRHMMDSWQDIIKDISDSMQYTSDVKERFVETVKYNILDGMKIQYFYKIPLRTYKLIATHEQKTDENIRLVGILAWCVALNMTNLVIEDDVVDNSVLRDGKHSWYLKNNKDNISLKDGHLLNQSAYQLLKNHFRGKPYYADLVEAFHQNDYKTTVSNICDKFKKHRKNDGKLLDCNYYTMERWAYLACLRLAPALTPVKLTMLHAGIRDPEVLKKYDDVATEIAKYISLANDFIDCFGDVEKTGNTGTDIAEGKCSILIVIALKHATPKQKQILQENYGFNDPEKIARVEKVYEDMDIVSQYCAIENEIVELINNMATKVSPQIPPKVFIDMMGENCIII